MNNDIISDAEALLEKRDPVLAGLIQQQTLERRPGTRGDYFAALTRAIIGQQVSVAAATSIYGRFEAQTKMLPENVLQLQEEDIKTIGLSRQKATYLGDLAQHFAKDPHVYHHLQHLDDEAVIKELTAVKGIGVWTAQMFLIFTLGRPDVFPPDDLGIQRAIRQLYGWESTPSKHELTKIAENWRPYRSVASLHLWQSLHNIPA
jgi:DNA-3-methyladenine glycosylase II